MASPNIDFDEIPSSGRKPGVYGEFNTKLAVRSLPANVQKVLIVAGRLASGSVAELVPVDVFSDMQAAEYFGYGSLAHRMVRAAITKNRYARISVVGVNDAAAGIAATSTLTLTGTATGLGVLTGTIGTDKIEVLQETGDSASVLAAKVVAALAGLPDLPVTATAALGVVTFTAKHKGTLGNQLKIGVTATAPGMTAAVTAFASGATDPNIAPALAEVFAADYNIYVTAWNDQANLTALRTHINDVSGPLEQRRARAVYGHTGSLAQATTLAGQLNSGRLLSVLAGGIKKTAAELAAAMAALAAGEEDPARPLNGLPLTGIDIPAIGDRLGRVEQENALANGVTPTEAGPGDVLQVVRAITTYTKNAAGIPDAALLEWMTLGTMDYVAKAIRERMALRFPREKKTASVKAKMRSEVLDVLIKLEELEIVENVEANKDSIVIEDDSQDVNRVNMKIVVDVVNGLHVIAFRLDLLL